jgi:hypothetical protein
MFVQRLESGDFDHGDNKPILLSDIYSFARRRSGNENRLLKIKIKLLILFGQTITFAGSTLLDDRFVIRLFDEMRPYFKEGYIIPDLRREADSFQHLAEIRRSEYPSKRIWSNTEALDTDIARVINFDASEVSNLFSHGLAGHIDEALKQTDDKEESDQLMKFSEGITTSTVPLTLGYVRQLTKNLKRPNEMQRIAELMYCITGAEVVGAHTFLPGYFIEEKLLWGDMLPRTYFTLHEMKVVESLFEHYAIDVSRLEFLSPQGVIELRNDRRIIDAMAELSRIVRKARESFVLDTSAAADYRKASAFVSGTINQLVKEACKREDRREKIFYLTHDVVIDLANIPFSNIGGRLIKRFVNWLGASRRTGVLGKSMTPLLTGSTVIREKLTGVNGSPGMPDIDLKMISDKKPKALIHPKAGSKLLK